MRRRHDTGWDFHPVSAVPPAPARAFGTEAWSVGTEGASTVTLPPRPSAKPALPTLRQTAWRTGRRHHRQLRPWLALLILPPVAYLGHAGHAAVAVTIVLAVLAVAVLHVTRPPVPGDAPAGTPRPRAYSVACAVLAVAWTGWASWQGLAHDYALCVLLAAWSAVSLCWWNRYRIRHHHDHGGTPSPVSAELTPDQLLERLRTRVCGQGQKLPGALVAPSGEIKGGRTFLFSLVPGRQSFENVRAAVTDIASAAEVPRSRVVAEPAPGDVPGEEGPANLAVVTIVGRQSAHREIQEFTGMTLAPETGLFDVGPYLDQEQARARLYKVDEDGRPMRAASGLTCGAQGSGKSTYMSHKVVEHMMSGLFKIFLIDGQGGASLPGGLVDHVDWPATWPEEWERCLLAVTRLMISRTRKIAQQRLGCWYATPEDPFVQVVMEEAHKPLRNPVSMRCVKAILQEGEKAGIGVDPSTQFPSQMELGGASGTAGANALRSLASSGNVTLFRTGDSSSKAMAVGQVEVDPRQLPQLPGACYPLGASMRLAPARAIRVKAPAWWAARAPVTTFSDLDLAALGGDYATRMERFAEHDAAPQAATLDMDSLERELAIITGQAPALTPAAAAERTETKTAISACWEAISGSGSAKRSALLADLGYSPSSVDQALAALEKTGKVRKGTGAGVWELTRPALHAVPGPDGADDQAIGG